MSFDFLQLTNISDIQIILGFLVLTITSLALYLCFKHWSKSQDPRDISWLEPPKNKLSIHQDLNIAYKQTGQGKDILFIHGIGSNTYCWRYLHSYFDTNKFRLTVIDLPGFGYSSKNKNLSYDLDEQSSHLIQFSKKMRLDRPILISSSMGSAISLNMSLLAPNYIDKVIAIAPAAGFKLIPFMLRKIKNVSFFFNWALSKPIMILILKRIFTRPQLVNPETVKGYLNPYTENKTESINAFINSAHLIMDKRVPLHFKGLKCSPLILASRKDKMVRKKHIKDLLQSLPKYEFHLHPNAGHHLMEDDPEWVYSKIKNYLYI